MSSCLRQSSPAWGLTIAARKVALPLPEYGQTLAVFAAGAMFLHSAACVLNDICDVEFDRQVGKRTLVRLSIRTNASLSERTKERPLPSGKVSTMGAWTLCLSLLVPVLYILSHADQTR